MGQYQVAIATRLGFRHDYAIAVHDDWAETGNISRMSELATLAPAMVLGTDQEYATRPDGLPQVKSIYGFTFKDVKQMEPTLIYEAIRNNLVDAITTYTTDGRVDLFNLRILDDDGSAFPPYDAIIIVKDDFTGRSGIMDQLGKLEGRIDTGTMRQLNYLYDVEKKSAREIARQFLVDNALLQD